MSIYLEGPRAPVTDEVTAFDLPVTGEIPSELEGRWLRNGPNPHGTVDSAHHHWFLGDGMVHGVRLRGGRAEGYRNRWVRGGRLAAALGEAMRAAELWIDGQRRYRRIPAISAALVRGDTTVWAKGFGTTDRAGRIPATPDTIYSICSISKLFTAVELMQQWERGTVALDAPIERYLPWARLADDPRDSVPITLRGLLTHSAGLPREADFPYWTGPDFAFPSQAQVRVAIREQTPLYPASTTWQYSNLGLTLVGETVEAVSGTPYAEYVDANILGPLGLDDTRAGIPAQLYGQQMAVGWGALEANGTRPEVGLFDPAGITPAAGFTASVADLAKFASWTFRVASSGEEEVLRPSTLREMQRVHYISPDWETSWGLGFSVRQEGGTTVVGHGGACPGYRSVLMLAPSEGMGVAVAMNAMDDPGGIARGIAALVKARGEAAPFDPDAPPLGIRFIDGSLIVVCRE